MYGEYRQGYKDGFNRGYIVGIVLMGIGWAIHVIYLVLL